MPDDHAVRPLHQSAMQETTKAALTLLLLLMSTDLAFIFLHLVYVETGWLRGADFSLEADGGLSETYQYVKEFWIAACMVVTFWHTRIRLYASWAIVFAFLMLDDAGQIHEHAGAWLGQQYALPAAFGLRSDDSGELLFAAMVGLSMLALVGLASWRADDQSRRVSRDILCLVVALTFVAVVVDALHVIAYFKGSLLAQVLLVVEDGGELIIMSALTVYSFHVASHRGRTRLDLWTELKLRLAGSGRRKPVAAVAAD